MVFGRSARVYLAPLFHHSTCGRSRISRRLRRALEWWERFLKCTPKRAVPFNPQVLPKLVLYTDATGAGSLAWTLVIGERKEFARAWVPRWLRRWAKPRKQQVGTWELVAAICCLWHVFNTEQAPMEILIFIDSNPALGTLLRGASKQYDWNALVAEIWFVAARRGDVLCAFRVPSKQNLADAPSRSEVEPQKVQSLIQDGFSEVQWSWPELDLWT